MKHATAAKRLALLGGGHAHVEVLRAFALEAIPGWRVTIVSPFERQLYSGMVPGVVAGHYTVDDCAIDVAALAKRAGADFVRSSASLVDPARREVVCANGQSLRYELLSFDIGAQVVIGKARGVDRHAIVIRPLEAALDAWSRIRARAATGEIRSITVVGGGPAGVELALAMAHALKADRADHPAHVRVVTDQPQPLGGIARGARHRLTRLLRKNGIGLHPGNAVVEVGRDFVQLEGGLQFASDATFWCTGPSAPEVIRDSGFATDEGGYLLTNEYMQSVSHADVFGVGDCATRRDRALPKAGAFAVRAAPILAANLRAAMTGQQIKPFATGTRYLALVSAGRQTAVGFWNGFAWQGDWVWRWKDRIDRRFVERYR